MERTLSKLAATQTKPQTQSRKGCMAVENTGPLAPLCINARISCEKSFFLNIKQRETLTSSRLSPHLELNQKFSQARTQKPKSNKENTPLTSKRETNPLS